MKIKKVLSRVLSKSPSKESNKSPEVEVSKKGENTTDIPSKTDKFIGFFKTVMNKVPGGSAVRIEEQKSLIKDEVSDAKEPTPESQIKKKSGASDTQSRLDQSLSQHRKHKKDKKSKQIHKGQVRNNSLAASKKDPKNSKALDKSDLHPTHQNDTLQEEEDDHDRAFDDRQEKNCDLCNRPRPIFVVETDDMIKRQPEQHLSELLKNLKKDFLCKRQYLKYLRINAKHITACNCENRVQHAYCVTAQVVRSQKIYCKDCGAYYHLYVKSEKLCSQELFGVIGRYICLFILLIGFAQCTLLLDSFLKQKHEDEELSSDAVATDITTGDVDDTLPAQTGFSFSRIENWIVMAPLTIILGIIMIWCFYFRFMKAVMARKRLIWVEVLDKNNPDFYISRYQAKQNLHLVGEITQKLRSYNYLFDKYWYRQREFQYIDAISQIEKRLFFNTLTDQQIKEMETGRPIITDTKAINLQDLDTPNIVERDDKKTSGFGDWHGQDKIEPKKLEHKDIDFTKAAEKTGFNLKPNSPFNLNGASDLNTLVDRINMPTEDKKKDPLNGSLTDNTTDLQKINEDISKEEENKKDLKAQKQPSHPEATKQPLKGPKEIRSMSIISFQPNLQGQPAPHDGSPKGFGLTKQESKPISTPGNQSGTGSSFKQYTFPQHSQLGQYKFKAEPVQEQAEAEVKKESPLDQIDKVGFNLVKSTIKKKSVSSGGDSSIKKLPQEGSGSLFNNNYKLQTENSAQGSPDITKPLTDSSPPFAQQKSPQTAGKPNSSTTDAITDKISFEADFKKDSSSNSEDKKTRILSEPPKVVREVEVKQQQPQAFGLQGTGVIGGAPEESQPSSLLAQESLYSTLESPTQKSKLIKQSELKIELIQEKETEEEEGDMQSNHEFTDASFQNKKSRKSSLNSVENANFSLERPVVSANNLTTEVADNHALFQARESIIEENESETGEGHSSIANGKQDSSSLPMIPQDSLENNGDLRFAEIVNQEASKVQDVAASENHHEVLDISDKDLQAMVESVWERYDADMSGALDKIETQMFLNDILGEQDRPAIQQEEFNKFFQEFDTNGNGEIEKLEMEVFLKRFIFSSVDPLAK